MNTTIRRRVLDYGIAAVALAVLSQGRLAPQSVTDPRALVLGLAVMVVTWLGGLGPGLVTATLGVLGAVRGGDEAGPPAAVALRFGLDAAMGILTGLMIKAHYLARHRAWPSDGRHYRRFVEEACGGIWAVDGEGLTTYANRRLGEILGVSREDMTGRRWHEFLAEPIPVLMAGEFDSHEVRLRRGDGAVRTAVISARPIGTDEGSDGRVVRSGGVLLTVIDISPLKRAEEALRAERNMSDTILETVGCLVVVLDPRGQILRLNRACRQMIGHQAEGAVGRAFWDVFLPAGEADGERELFEQLRAGNGSLLDATHWKIRNGHERQIAWSNATLADPWGRIAYVIATGIDVTDLKLVEESLREAKERAEDASGSKDRFLAVLSHELRTPLTPVLLSVTAMLEAGPDPALRRALEMIRRNVKLESRLIGDLLDVVRIGRGGLRLDLEVVDVHESIRHGVEICRDEAMVAGLEIEAELAASGHHVLADQARIMQVIWNLIRNAARFTGPDGGTLAIRTSNSPGLEQHTAGVGTSRPRLVIEFADTGIGIDPSVMTRIFEPFEQGHADLRGRFGGLGLGLSISRSLAEALGGRLSVISPGKDRGSTFRLELDVVPAPACTAPAAPEDAPSRPRLRVLVVEDNKDTLNYLALVLRGYGHEVVTADRIASARAAAAASTYPFDLLLSDIELPDGNGHDLMRQLGSRLPGLAMSGYGSEEDVKMSLAAGFSEHLTKPLDTDQLIAAIDRIAAPGRPDRSCERLAPHEDERIAI